jgi:photosystem II stability/assembly factor-like uncharacterized protein
VTWAVVAQKETSADLFGVHFADAQHGWAAGARGTMLYTEDAGETWRLQRTNTVTWLEAVYFLNSKRGVAVGSQGTILLTEDAGETWRFVDRNVREWLYDVTFADAQRGYAVGERGIIFIQFLLRTRSTDSRSANAAHCLQLRMAVRRGSSMKQKTISR